MQYAKVVDNNIIEIRELLEFFPNTSFPITGPDSYFLEENSLVPVYNSVGFDDTLYNSINVEPFIVGNAVHTYRIISKTDEEILMHANMQNLLMAENIRQQRDKLLQESDWTQVADVPVDKTAWATYRQALRDITTQEGFPFNVVWPTI